MKTIIIVAFIFLIGCLAKMNLPNNAPFETVLFFTLVYTISLILIYYGVKEAIKQLK